MKSNSIRLRLTQSEVALISEGGSVEEKTWFPNDARFIFKLTSNDRVKQINAIFDLGVLSVFLPQAVAGQWATTDQIGVEARIPTEAGHDLRILIEKDFACLDRYDEDADAFPNPLACSGSKA